MITARDGDKEFQVDVEFTASAIKSIRRSYSFPMKNGKILRPSITITSKQCCYTKENIQYCEINGTSIALGYDYTDSKFRHILLLVENMGIAISDTDLEKLRGKKVDSIMEEIGYPDPKSLQKEVLRIV